MILRMLLEKCKTVKRSAWALKRIPRCSAGTLVIADLSGDACLVEFTNDKLASFYFGK